MPCHFFFFFRSIAVHQHISQWLGRIGQFVGHVGWYAQLFIGWSLSKPKSYLLSLSKPKSYLFYILLLGKDSEESFVPFYPKKTNRRHFTLKNQSRYATCGLGALLFKIEKLWICAIFCCSYFLFVFCRNDLKVIYNACLVHRFSHTCIIWGICNFLWSSSLVLSMNF